jgi:polyhydroxybutyrate depolymerase
VEGTDVLRIIALTILACAMGFGHAFAESANSADPLQSIQIGAQTRFYTITRYHEEEMHARLPILLYLHGLGSVVTRPIPAQFDIPFTTLPDMEPALVVRPQGANRAWDSIPGNIDTWRRLAGLDGDQVDDIGFLRTLIGSLVENDRGDPGRVYVAGVSSGGYLAARIACELSDRITAVAIVIATARKSQFSSCDQARPVPLVLIASTTDPENPYVGQEGDEISALASAPDTVSYFSAHNGCTSRTETPLPHLNFSDKSTISLIRYLNCAMNAEVFFYRIDGADHSVPSKAPPEAGSEKSLGNRNRDIETAAVLWAFFQQHRW